MSERAWNRNKRAPGERKEGLTITGGWTRGNQKFTGRRKSGAQNGDGHGDGETKGAFEKGGPDDEKADNSKPSLPKRNLCSPLLSRSRFDAELSQAFFRKMLAQDSFSKFPNCI